MDVKIGDELHGGVLSLGKAPGECKRFRGLRAGRRAALRRLEKGPGTA